MSGRPGPTVVFVSLVSHFGGSAISLRALLRHLDPGIRRVLAAPEGPLVTALVEEDLVDTHVPVAHHRASTLVRAVPQAIGSTRLAAWARRHRHEPLVIHANGLAEAVVAAPAAAAAGAAMVAWVHGDDTGRRRSRHLTGLVDRLVPRLEWSTVSVAAADALAAASGLERSALHVIPNPIELGTGPRPPADGGPLRVGYLGTDSHRKGFDLLPAIAERLDEGVVLRVYARRHEGIDSAMARSWQALEELGPRVELVGRQDDPADAYAGSDLVLCPSRSESFCRVVAEAQASGCPPVASDLPAIRELVGDDEGGLLFPVGAPDAAARAVRRLLDDATLRARLAAAGRDRAAAFAPQAVARRFEALYGAGPA